MPCTSLSRIKVRSRRGENWLLASCNVTTVSEKANAVTVTMAPAMVCSRLLAAVGPPPKIHAATMGWTLS